MYKSYSNEVSINYQMSKPVTFKEVNLYYKKWKH